MSHFITIVTNTQDKGIDDQLAPYSEELESPAYEVDCYCIGSIARKESYAAAEKQLKYTIDDKRTAFWNMPEAERPNWKEFIKEFTDLQEKLEKENPLYKKPAVNCSECEGTGKRTTTYNPDSKWDWYQTGGRWAGYFKLKPGKEGVRGEHGVMESYKSEDGVDVVKVEDIDFKVMGDDIVPFAILHEGKWYERGSMGWWGMVSDEKDEAEWNKQVKKLLSELPATTEITAVDCHI